MYMHTIFWCAQAHILAKFGWIRDMKVSMRELQKINMTALMLNKKSAQ